MKTLEGLYTPFLVASFVNVSQDTDVDPLGSSRDQTHNGASLNIREE
jgi:hypothetical protein